MRVSHLRTWNFNREQHNFHASSSFLGCYFFRTLLDVGCCYGEKELNLKLFIYTYLFLCDGQSLSHLAHLNIKLVLSLKDIERPGSSEGKALATDLAIPGSRLA